MLLLARSRACRGACFQLYYRCRVHLSHLCYVYCRWAHMQGGVDLGLTSWRKMNLRCKHVSIRTGIGPKDQGKCEDLYGTSVCTLRAICANKAAISPTSVAFLASDFTKFLSRQRHLYPELLGKALEGVK